MRSPSIKMALITSDCARCRLYVEKLGESPSDPVELHLLYTQAKGCVLRGKYAVTDTEALLLAALSLQVERRLPAAAAAACRRRRANNVPAHDSH